MPEGHLCCGSAGTYNILQPEIAARLRDRKVAISKYRPDVIAAGNIGCIAQLAAGTAIPAAMVRANHLGQPRAGSGTAQAATSTAKAKIGKAIMAKKRKAKEGRQGQKACGEACGSGAPEKGRRAEARPQGESQIKGQADAPRREIEAAAAFIRTCGAAADDRARSRGDADRAATVAVPLVPGDFPPAAQDDTPDK